MTTPQDNLEDSGTKLNGGARDLIEVSASSASPDNASRVELYNSLLEQSENGVFVSDPLGNYIEVNSAGCRMLGYSRSELLRLNIADVIYPAQIPRVEPEVARFNDGKLVISTWKFLRKDGTTFNGLVRGKQLSDGKLQGILVELNDRENSERMLAEKKFKESEERFRILMQQAPEAIIVFDVDNNLIIDANVNAEKLLQCSREELLTRSMLGFLHQADTDQVPVAQSFDEHNKLAMSHEQVVFERLVRGKAGKESVCEVRLTRLPAEGRRLVRSSLVDITERKRAERERETALALLSESELKFKQIFDSSPEPIIISDDSGRMTMVNRQLTRLMGYCADELIGHEIEMLMPVRYRLGHPAIRRGYVYGPASQRMTLSREVKALHKSGTEIEVEVSLSKIHVRGKFLFLSSLHDLTERKNAERAIKESEFRFHQLMDNMTEGYSVIGFDWRFVYINNSAAAHGRSTPDQLIGKNLLQAFPEIEKGEIFKSFERVMSERAGEFTEASYAFTDGTVAWFELRTSPVKEGISVFSVEITQRKKIEVELEQKRAFVTYLSRLAILGELSGAIAHELNQPLMSILMNAESAQLLLKKNPDNLTEVNEILAEIVEEDIRASNIIKRLRKLFAQQETINLQVNLNALVAEVARILKNELLNRGIKLKLELDPAISVVNIDRIQVEQVFMNLIINACDAIDENLQQKSRTVICRTVQERDVVRASVIDSGAGIQPENMAKVFDPFFTTKKQGMGLGLSICRNIINAQSGLIWVENNLNGVSSFHFTLPVQQ